MRFNKLNLLFPLILVLSLFIIEMIFRFERGVPILKEEPPQFHYQYVEIYKRFFKKVSLSDGKVVYKAQRSMATRQTFFPHKEKNTKRLFVIGGSVALPFSGDQGIFLENIFKSLFPSLEFEVIGCGMGSYDSYRESIVLKEVLNYSPDFIILMSGNNEYYTPVKINVLAYNLNRLFDRFWIYREIHGKIKPLIHTKIPNYSLEERLRNFEKNLWKMIKNAKEKNVPIALCALPANLRDSPPAVGVPDWSNEDFFLAWRAFEEDDIRGALEKFKQYIITHPQDAFGHYFLAKCYEKMKEYSQAKAYYLKALDLDSGYSRSSPAKNKIIRDLCAKEDVILIDLEKAFMESSLNGLPGSDLFLDNCHWWGEYHQLVSEEVVRSIISYNNNHRGTILPLRESQQEVIFSRKAYIVNNNNERLEQMAIKEIASAFAFILNYSENYPNESSIALFETANRFRPDLFENKGYLKERLFKELSINTWSSPYLSKFEEIWPIFLFNIGEASRRLKFYSIAVDYFNESINILPDKYWFPYLGRGLCYLKLNDIEKAKSDLGIAIKRSHNDPLVKLYKETLGI